MKMAFFDIATKQTLWIVQIYKEAVISATAKKDMKAKTVR